MPLLRIEDPQPGVRRLALDRPEKRNALSPELRDVLIEAVAEASMDAEVQAILLTGVGGHFSAGGDLASLDGLDGPDARRRIQGGHDLVRRLIACEKPVVAAVEGYAMGAGAALAMTADTVVIEASTTIGFPFLKVGLGPDFAASYLLPRRIGPQKARQALLRAQNFAGEAAVAMGLADELAEPGQVQERALAICAEYARMPPAALALVKRQLQAFPQSLEAALEMEATVQPLCMAGAEFKEGLAAFKEKRAPRFR